MAGLEALQQLRLPDGWQVEAIRALAAGDDVIVQASTDHLSRIIYVSNAAKLEGRTGRPERGDRAIGKGDNGNYATRDCVVVHRGTRNHTIIVDAGRFAEAPANPMLLSPPPE